MFMSNYEERDIGVAYVHEKLEQGYYRVISEDGRNDCLRPPASVQWCIGDKGRLVYYTDKNTYGLTKFVPDNSVEIDFDKLVNNYNSKWNANISISK